MSDENKEQEDGEEPKKMGFFEILVFVPYMLIAALAAFSGAIANVISGIWSVFVALFDVFF